MIKTSYYYTQLNLTDDTPIMLDTYSYREDAEQHFQCMTDKNILQESFDGLTNIPTEEFATISLIQVTKTYGTQTGQKCIARKTLWPCKLTQTCIIIRM